MKEIAIRTDKYQYEELASMSQDVHQCENYSLTLHKIGKAVVRTKMDLRFDDAYGKVYEREGDSYVFIGTYFAYGINNDMSDGQKQAIVEAS